jgi:hypothetical protein
MADEIERQFGAKGLHTFSLRPGSIGTELQRHIPQDQLSCVAQGEYLATSSGSTTNWAIGKGEGQAWIPNLLKGESHTMQIYPLSAIRATWMCGWVE